MLDYQWILMVFGFVAIVSLSHIMNPIRELAHKIHPKVGQLLGCPMCFGFWAGVIFNLIGYSHYGIDESYSVLFDGLLASGSSYILHCITWRMTTFQEHQF
jgi:hypothetical protein